MLRSTGAEVSRTKNLISPRPPLESTEIDLAIAVCIDKGTGTRVVVTLTGQIRCRNYRLCSIATKIHGTVDVVGAWATLKSTKVRPAIAVHIGVPAGTRIIISFAGSKACCRKRLLRPTTTEVDSASNLVCARTAFESAKVGLAVAVCINKRACAGIVVALTGEIRCRNNLLWSAATKVHGAVNVVGSWATLKSAKVRPTIAVHIDVASRAGIVVSFTSKASGSDDLLRTTAAEVGRAINLVSSWPSFEPTEIGLAIAIHICIGGTAWIVEVTSTGKTRGSDYLLHATTSEVDRTVNVIGTRRAFKSAKIDLAIAVYVNIASRVQIVETLAATKTCCTCR